MNIRYTKKLDTFCQFASILADLSTCARARVGAVVVPPELTSVLSIGYNGPPRGIRNDACTGELGTCGCVHAEANAMIKLNSDRRDLILISTTAPCAACAALIINKQCIDAVCWKRAYRNNDGLYLLAQAGITHYDHVQ